MVKIQEDNLDRINKINMIWKAGDFWQENGELMKAQILNVFFMYFIFFMFSCRNLTAERSEQSVISVTVPNPVNVVNPV